MRKSSGELLRPLGLVFLLVTFSYAMDPNLSDEIIVQLSDEDLNAIKSAEVCTETDGLDCYLSFMADAIRDAVGNSIEGDINVVDKFKPDERAPKLVQFLLYDNDQGLLLLSFTEVVDTASANYSALTLQEDFTDSSSYTLRRNLTISEPMYSTILNFTLHQDDHNELKRIDDICTSKVDCIVRFTTYFVTDVAGNRVEAVRSGEFILEHRVDIFIPDETPPNLIDFTVDLDQRIVTLVFDETVSRTTLLFREITFTASNASVSSNYTLPTAILLSTVDGTSLSFEITDDSANALKAIPDFFTNTNDTFIVFPNITISDTSSNPIVPRKAGESALQVSEFLPDVTSPVATSFVLLDMKDNFFQVSFNEPVDLAPVNFSAIVIRSGPLTNTSAIAVRLTGASNVRYTSDDKLTIEVQFTDSDRQTLKLLNPNIGTNPSDSFIVLGGTAVQDVSGNKNVPTTTALSAVSVQVDDEGPTVLSFVLNLNNNTLELNFSDVVVVSTLDPSEISFQSNMVRGDSDSVYTLTGGISNSLNGFVVLIDLTDADVDALNSITDLATNTSNTFITVTAAAIQDVFGFNVISVIPAEALQATEVIEDKVNPSVLLFKLRTNERTVGPSSSTCTDSAERAVAVGTFLFPETSCTAVPPSTIKLSEGLVPMLGLSSFSVCRSLSVNCTSIVSLSSLVYLTFDAPVSLTAIAEVFVSGPDLITIALKFTGAKSTGSLKLTWKKLSFMSRRTKLVATGDVTSGKNSDT